MESCEIRLEAGRNLGLVQRWRFVAEIDAETAPKLVEASDSFWSLPGLVFATGRERAVLGSLLHRLELAGWRQSVGEGSTRGRPWYAHRLYRRPGPRRTGRARA